MKRILAISLLIGVLFASFVAAQDSLDSGAKTLRCEGDACRVGENATLNVTLVNPLPIPDTLSLRFHGEATDMLDFHFPEGLDCKEDNDINTCKGIQMGSNAEEEYSITLEASSTSFGEQKTLEATVNSTNTHLSSTDQITVRIEPYFAPVTVSAPGIQGIHVFFLILLASILAGFISRR